jgi:hypothetical protein
MWTSRSAAILAFAKLAPADDRTREAIANALGLDWIPETSVPPPVEPEEPLPETIAPTEPPAPPPPRVVVQRAEHAPPPSTEERSLPFRLETGETGRRQAPDWLANVPDLPRPPAGFELLPLVPEPLLAPRWARAILSGALSAETPGGPLDVETIIRMIASGQMVRELPRLPWPSLARGVQLLVDRSEAMEPFSFDQDWLVKQIDHVVGSYAIEVVKFRGSPMFKAGTGPRRTWKPYPELPPPRPGTTIVALTDLGIGQPPPPAFAVRPADWLDFADHVRRLGCPLLALVPYASTRWPAELTKAMTIVQWDRRTTAGRVRSRVGRGLRVSGKVAT